MTCTIASVSSPADICEKSCALRLRAVSISAREYHWSLITLIIRKLPTSAQRMTKQKRTDQCAHVRIHCIHEVYNIPHISCTATERHGSRSSQKIKKSFTPQFPQPELAISSTSSLSCILNIPH